MATRFRLVLDHDGIRELISSGAIAKECKKAAEAIASRAGAGFEVVGPQDLRFGGGRVGYGVRAATEKAKVKEANDGTLSKAVR